MNRCDCKADGETGICVGGYAGRCDGPGQGWATSTHDPQLHGPHVIILSYKTAQGGCMRLSAPEDSRITEPASRGISDLYIDIHVHDSDLS